MVAALDDLVAAEMGVSVDECVVYFEHDVVDYLIGEIQGRIKLPLILLITLNNNILKRSRSAPTLRMRRRIKLRYNPNSPNLRIIDNRFNLSLRVSTRELTILRKFRSGGNYHRETVLVCYVPVQDGHFVVH